MKLDYIESNGVCSVQKSSKQVPPASSSLEQKVESGGFSRGGIKNKLPCCCVQIGLGFFVKACFV